MKTLILIDFSWLYNKYYYTAYNSYSVAFKEENPEEVLERILREFLTLVERVYKCRIFMVLDSPTATLKNFKLFEGYKQNRNKEEKKEVYKPFNKTVMALTKTLNSKSFSFIKAKLYEADQLLAYIVKKYHDKHNIIIYSGDKDLLQLTAYPNTYISEKFEKGKFLLKSDKEIFEKFKNSKGEDFTRISTNKKDILKYRVLKGDTSDNLSPVFPRIKDTEITDIVKNYWLGEEELTEVGMNNVIESLKVSNPKLAEKLNESKEVWLRNYKIMDLFHVDDMDIRRLK
jgi:5'-3' exonuclease